jgi:hypothetical protein
VSLLFEDLFKRLNSDLKRQADAVLSKANRATQVSRTSVQGCGAVIQLEAQRA